MAAMTSPNAGKYDLLLAGPAAEPGVICVCGTAMVLHQRRALPHIFGHDAVVAKCVWQCPACERAKTTTGQGPLSASLMAEVIDGGLCTSCGKPAVRISEKTVTRTHPGVISVFSSCSACGTLRSTYDLNACAGGPYPASLAACPICDSPHINDYHGPNSMAQQCINCGRNWWVADVATEPTSDWNSICGGCGSKVLRTIVHAGVHYQRCPVCQWQNAQRGGDSLGPPVGTEVCTNETHLAYLWPGSKQQAIAVCWGCNTVSTLPATIIKHPERTCYNCGSSAILPVASGAISGARQEHCQDCGADWWRGETQIRSPYQTQDVNPQKERFMALDLVPETAAQTALIQELDVHIRARYPLIAVETAEEPRFLRIMATVQALEQHRLKPLFQWSRIEGLRQIAGPGMGLNTKAIPDTADPISALEHIAKLETGFVLLCDFAPYLAPYGQESPELVRQLRELAWAIKTRYVTVFIVGPHAPELEGLAEIKTIPLPLPDEAEVCEMLDSHLEFLAQNPVVKHQMEGDTHERLVAGLLGLTEFEIENVLAKATTIHRGITPAALPIVVAEKKDAIRKSGSLTYHDPEPLDHYGGYEHVRQLLHEAALTFSPEARAYGVDESKGFLLIGLPGVGKDLLKRVASGVLGRPLVDFDFGAVMGEGGGIVGQAAMSIKRALQIADTIKPVLGLSEFEKGVGGLASSGRSDGGETARTIGILLNWMQEQSGTFVVATANDVRQLAPEQVRQGRFSQILFVDLPTIEDRRQIFSVWLTRKGRNPEEFDLDALASATDGYSGAEIEAVVKGGLLIAFADGARPLTTDDLMRRREKITPIGVLKRQEIEEIRTWAKDHLGAVDATTAPKPKPRAGERALEF